MRVVALAATFTVAVASVGLSGCTSRGLVYPGYSPGWTAPPLYSGAPYAPAPVVYPGYYAPTPEPPPISAYGAYVPPRAACAPVWRCGYQGCGWQSGCAPRREVYSGQNGPPSAQVYSRAAAAPQPYARRYGPQVNSGATRPHSGDQTYGSAYR
jgi:hypothetical protein